MKLEILLEIANKEVKVKNGRITNEYPDEPFKKVLNVEGKRLTTLEGFPKIIEKYFDCSDNRLTSLEGGPSSIGDRFKCSHNKLTTLKGAPSSVGGHFYCDNNELTSLEGIPTHVRFFKCDSNKLTSLEQFTLYCDSFSCEDNHLSSLKNIHKCIKQMDGSFFASNNPITSHVLGLLLIKGCKTVFLDNKEVTSIINKYLPEGRAGLTRAQNELIEAGFEEYAQV